LRGISYRALIFSNENIAKFEKHQILTFHRNHLVLRKKSEEIQQVLFQEIKF